MKPFQLLHSDVKDMIKRSYNGYFYVLTVLDNQLIVGNVCQLTFLKNKKPVLTCQSHVEGSTMFWLSSKIESISSLSIRTGTVYATDYSIWHQHMGHPGDDILHNLPNVVKGAPRSITIPSAKKPCEACVKGKMHNKTFPSSSS